MSRRLFVTGTDTGVGKTHVVCALVAAMARRGSRVAVMKPCETGGGDDAVHLVTASGRALPLAEVRPYALELPASPAVAARAAGVAISLPTMLAAAERLAADSDLLLIEGAGGILVPLDEAHTMADLAQRLSAPVLVVGRPGLGTVNHTCLTIEAARARGLSVLGFAFSRGAPPRGPDEPSNPDAVARRARAPFLGTLPPVSLADPADLAAAAERYLAVSAILQRLYLF